MSKSELKQIEKNLKHAADFQEYVLQNPSVIDHLPAGAQIVFDMDSLTHTKHKKQFRALKKGKKWNVQALPA